MIGRRSFHAPATGSRTRPSPMHRRLTSSLADFRHATGSPANYHRVAEGDIEALEAELLAAGLYEHADEVAAYGRLAGVPLVIRDSADDADRRARGQLASEDLPEKH